MIKVRNELWESPCYLCDFACSSKQQLARHTFRVHGSPESLICSYCKFKLKDVSSVRRHIKTVHMNTKDYMCTYCNKKYKHKYDLEKHFSKVHKTEPLEGHNYCSECKLMCFGWEQLKKHYLDSHGKTIQHIKCPQCFKIFFDVMYLKQHFKRTHNNNSLSVVCCQHCGAVFEEDTALVRHMEEKHFWNGETAVFCRQAGCDELFEDMTELKTHIQAVHKKNKRQRVSSEEFCSTDSGIECPICTLAVPNKSQLVSHLMDVHYWRSVMECQKCFKLFPTSFEVQEHLNSHRLEPDDAPLLPSGKKSILKKRLLKRKNIKDLTDMETRYYVGFVRLDDQKAPHLQEEVVVETNEPEPYHHHHQTGGSTGETYHHQHQSGGSTGYHQIEGEAYDDEVGPSYHGAIDHGGVYDLHQVHKIKTDDHADEACKVRGGTK